MSGMQYYDHMIDGGMKIRMVQSSLKASQQKPEAGIEKRQVTRDHTCGPTYLSQPSHSALLHSMVCFSLLGCKILKVWTLSLITLPYLPASCLAHRRLSTNAS